MQRVVIACKTMEAELRRFLGPDVELRSMEQGLHRYPDQLKDELQREIDSIDGGEILMAYGLCGNGVIGLRSSTARIVIPRVDDCISILLGSAQRYREAFQNEPGTYWLSHGWIEHAEDPYKEYLRCKEKYGEETARWVANEMMKSYKKVTLIDTGACPMTQIREYAQHFAEFFELDYAETAGSDALLRELESPPWDSERFVVVEPGQIVTQEAFVVPLGYANG